MKSFIKSSILFLLVQLIFSCSTKTSTPIAEQRATIEMVTDYGTIIIELYNETPLHRENFIKLAREGAFDSLLFHRVIENFMIQSGDPESRYANASDTLGNGDLPYMVNAELNPTLFHKKGALGAARNGNLARASSSMQFYIVEGKVLNDSLLTVAESRINDWLAEHYLKHDPANKALVDSLQKTEADENWKRYTFFNDSIRTLAKSYKNFEQYIIPEAHRIVYKSIGGTPHLDQNYTVFGEVISGIEVVDAIAAVQTGLFDRPTSDVRIISVRVKE